MSRDSSLIASLPPGNRERCSYRASRSQRTLVNIRRKPRVWLLWVVLWGPGSQSGQQSESGVGAQGSRAPTRRVKGK